MTDRELLQEALDAILAAIKSGDWKVDGACDPDFVINALRARLAQPELEWVGLTDEELEFYTEELGQGELGRGVLRAVVDFLKEKNT